MRDSVETYSDQTYRARQMDVRSTTQPGTVTFSIFDPNAEINFLLPVQTNLNSSCSGANCGRMNLQNPNSLDRLVFFGDTNYINNENTVGAGGWASSAQQNNALGYVPSISSNNQTRESIAFHQHAQNILGEFLSIRSDDVATVRVSMPTGTQPMANANKLNPGSFQTFGSRTEIPQPATGMVNIVIQVLVNGVPTNLATTVPAEGMVFRLPEALIPRYTAITQEISANGLSKNVQLVAVQSDGKPLPSWLKFNPETKTFAANRVPEGAPDLPIKIQTIQEGRVIDEIMLVIDTKN